MKNKYNDKVLYKVVRPIVKGLLLFLYTPRIINKEYIPTSGRVILAGNHTNILDCILLMSCTKRSIHFLAKNELWKGPKKIIFSNMGLIPVDRKSHDHLALQLSEEYKYIIPFVEHIEDVVSASMVNRMVSDKKFKDIYYYWLVTGTINYTHTSPIEYL